MTERSPPASWNPRPRRPSWGVHPPSRKYDAGRRAILVAPVPDRVRISLAQAAAPPAIATVSPGQRVLRGEPIGAPAEPGGPWVHASIAGTVVRIGEAPVAGPGGPVPCVDIESDGTDEPWPGHTRRLSPGELGGAALCELVARGGIVGLGGALFPTATKLAAPGIRLLLLNGAECEPYLSCDDLLLRERPGQVVTGARFMLDALGAERGVIAVKTDMTQARVALSQAIEAAGDPRIALSVVTARYPAGGERQLIELVTDREVPSGGLPPDIGVLCHNVATAAAVAEYLTAGEPLIRRIVTVGGGGIVTPTNIDARIGTSIRDLVTLAGGYHREPRRLIMGGPMMGIALPSDELPITRATNAIIAATSGELGAPAPVLPCIRCGDCVEVCPARLMPWELYFAVKRRDPPALDELGVMDCIECRACDYVCPSYLPLAGSFIEGKAMLADHLYERELADEARERFERHRQRLEREAREQEEALAALRPPDTATPGADASGPRPPGKH